MTAQVQELLHSFERLSNDEQWELAFEIGGLFNSIFPLFKMMNLCIVPKTCF